MAKRTQSYVDEAFKRIQSQPNILGVVILNAIGNPVKSTWNEYESLQYAGHYDLLLQKTKFLINQIDPTDEVISLRVRSRFHETIVTPDEKITFVVVQNAIDKINNEPVFY